MLQGEFLHPREHEILIFTDASNTGWGTHLNQESTGGLWSLHVKHLHESFRTEGSFSGSTILQKQLQQQLSPHSLRQHFGGVIHQQTGQNKVSSPMCADLENSQRVPQQQGNTQSKALSPQIFKKVSRVWASPQVDLFATNLNKKLPLYVSPIPDTQAWAVDALNIMGKPGCIRFSSHCPPAQVDTKAPVSSMQDNLNCPRLADQTVILGSCGDV